ncbi:MAG: hypothetical protein KAI64_05305 [Thermoplasmata archaeon]|nr:hypothetical protein [Thermoplasmata archaeon]
MVLSCFVLLLLVIPGLGVSGIVGDDDIYTTRTIEPQLNPPPPVSYAFEKDECYASPISFDNNGYIDPQALYTFQNDPERWYEFNPQSRKSIRPCFRIRLEPEKYVYERNEIVRVNVIIVNEGNEIGPVIYDTNWSYIRYQIYNPERKPLFGLHTYASVSKPPNNWNNSIWGSGHFPPHSETLIGTIEWDQKTSYGTLTSPGIYAIYAEEPWAALLPIDYQKRLSSGAVAIEIVGDTFSQWSSAISCV